MSRQSQLEASFAIARRLLERLSELRLRPIPRNYLLWYASLDGTRPELATEIEGTVKTEGGLSQSMVDAIYERQFGLGEDGETLLKVADRIERSLSEVLGLVGEAGSDAKAYGSTVAGLGRDLDGAESAGSVRAVVTQLLAATQDMSRRAERVETRLKSSTEEVNALKRDLEDSRQEAMTDALTGLGNRKHFDQRLSSAMYEADAERAPLVLLMLDVDHFKSFNDTHGHQLGDEVLRLVAGTLREGVKGQDTIARYGGDEFAIILPETDVARGMQVATKLHQALNAQCLLYE